MYCVKCGYEMGEDAKFCPKCGASAEAGGAAQGGFDAPPPRQDYSGRTADSWERVSYQPAPKKRGLPVWGWVLIGCGGLIVLSFAAIMIFAVQATKIMTEKFGSIEELGAAAEVSQVQSALSIYNSKNNNYGDFIALRDGGDLSALTIKSITATELELDLTQLALEITDGGAGYKLTAKSKDGKAEWELDETSKNLMEDAMSGWLGGMSP